MTRAHRSVLVALGVVAALVLAGPMLPGGAMGPGMMWGYAWPYAFSPWGWHFFGMGWPYAVAFGFRALSVLIFWAIIVLSIVLLVRWTSGPSGHGDRR